VCVQSRGIWCACISFPERFSRNACDRRVCILAPCADEHVEAPDMTRAPASSRSTPPQLTSAICEARTLLSQEQGFVREP